MHHNGPMQETLDELSHRCHELASSNWGMKQTETGMLETGHLPVKICSRAAMLLRSFNGTKALRMSALGVIQKAFGTEDGLADRLLNILELEIILLRKGGAMVKSFYALDLLTALLNIVPQGFKLHSPSDLTTRLLKLLLSGIEGQLQGGSGLTVQLKPLRDVLMETPLLCENLPACLSSVMKTQLDAVQGVEHNSGEPCSSLGHPKPEPPTNDWLWAAGNFAQEVADICNDPSLRYGKHHVETLSLLQQAVMDAMMNRSHADAVKTSPPRKMQKKPAAAADRATSTPLRSSSKGLAGVDMALSSKSTELETAKGGIGATVELAQHGIGPDFAKVILEILLEFAGGAEQLVAKLVAMAQAELGRLAACSQESAKAGSKKIFAITCLINATLTLDGVNTDALGEQAVPGLVHCILHGADLPHALREDVRPLLDIATSEALVCHSASFLWDMMTDGGMSTNKMASQFLNHANMVYAAGCLSVEIEDGLLRNKKSFKDGRVEQSLQSMRCLQWICHCHLAWLEQSKPPGGLSLPTPPQELEQATGVHPRPSASRGPDKKKRAARTADLYAPSSSAGVRRQAPAGGCEAASGSEYDESEDIHTTSSESEDQPDHGSDLEPFIDHTSEGNPYGLMQQVVDEGSSAPFLELMNMKGFMESELIDNYQDCADALITKFPDPLPGPSSPTTDKATGSSPDEESSMPAKRRRQSPLESLFAGNTGVA